MQIRMLQSLAASYRIHFQAGTIIETDKEQARRLIAGGMAEAVGPEETKAVAPPVNRMLRPKANRNRK